MYFCLFNLKKPQNGDVGGPCFSPEKVISKLHLSIILLCLQMYLEALAYKYIGKYLSEGMYFWGLYSCSCNYIYLENMCIMPYNYLWQYINALVWRKIFFSHVFFYLLELTRIMKVALVVIGAKVRNKWIPGSN